MEDIMAMDWPACGVVKDGSTARTLFVNANKYLHPGMRVYVVNPAFEDQDHPDSVVQCVAADADPATGKVVLEQPLGFDPVASPFQCATRVPPQSVDDWTATDVALAILDMWTSLRNVDTDNMDSIRGLLSTGDVQLSAQSTIQELDGLWTEQRRWLDLVRTEARKRGLMGRQVDDQTHAKRLNSTVAGMAAAYETLCRNIQLKQAREDAPLGADDSLHVNPWWVTTCPLNQGEFPSESVELIEFFLAHARRQNIRKNAYGIVYEEVLSTAVQPAEDKDQPPCKTCGAAAVWGHPDQRGGGGGFFHNGDWVPGPQPLRERTDLYCEAHRGEEVEGAVDVRFDDQGALYDTCRSTRTVGTKAWRPRMSAATGRPLSIDEWMETVMDRTVYYTLWCKYVANYSPMKSNIAKVLRDTGDYSIPVVTHDRLWYSFRNGVYNIETNEFVDFTDGRLPHSLCTANFIDQEFDPEWTQVPVATLDVEGYDSILDCQRYSPDMKKWIDTFFGRLFFPIGRHDKWEKLMVIKGWAATGKSTIAKAIAQIIGEQNVGYIASNCEEQWALANVYDKHMWMCLELKSGFRLPTGTMQSMVSGENVVINEKFKTAISIVWKLQGLLVGNELPTSWTADVCNALARRVLPFPFDIAPATQDAGLAPRLMANMSKMFVRMVRTYMDQARQFGLKQLDPLLPPELRSSMKEFAKMASPVRKFIDDTQELTQASGVIKTCILWELAIAQHFDKHLNVSDLEKIETDFRELVELYNIDYGAGPGKVYVDGGGKKELPPPSGRKTLELLGMYRVRMADIQKMFKNWAGNVNVKFDITLEENYKMAARELQVPVVGAVRVKVEEGSAAVTTIRDKCWYGLCITSDKVPMPSWLECAGDPNPNGIPYEQLG